MKSKKLVQKILNRLTPQCIINNKRKSLDQKEFEVWTKKGSPVPPPHLVKQKAIKEYQEKTGNVYLIETGTYLGDMVEAQKKNFKKIYSIELSDFLQKKAQKRFKRNKNIKIVLGDSGKVLPQILENIYEPAIFWLDGHYSAGVTAKGDKECPIFEELNAIFKSKKLDHVLLIDDARLFTGKGDYPTIEELTQFVKSKNERYQLEVKDDIIRYTI
jgi:hypothetical protein